MERRHEDELLAVLDRVYHQGSAVIPWWRIHCWWRVERVSKTPYRGIWQQWSGHFADKPRPRLFLTPEGVLIVRRDHNEDKERVSEVRPDL